MSGEEQSDHDLLTQLVNDMCWVKENLTNHLKHHWVLEAAIIGAVITGLIAAIAAKLFG